MTNAKTTGTFTAREANGTEHTITVFQGGSEAIDKTETRREMWTSDFLRVNKTSTGFEIVTEKGERIPLTSDDPNAPRN